jgi:hypothetical protein
MGLGVLLPEKTAENSANASKSRRRTESSTTDPNVPARGQMELAKGFEPPTL